MSLNSTNRQTVRDVIAECGGQRDNLRCLAGEIVDAFSAADPAGEQDLLGTFLLEIAISAADQRRRKELRQRQAEGIAAAKARGVRFGRHAPPLPEEFDEMRQAWRDGQLSLRQAANACGMSKSSFYNAALRKEQ